MTEYVDDEFELDGHVYLQRAAAHFEFEPWQADDGRWHVSDAILAALYIGPRQFSRDEVCVMFGEDNVRRTEASKAEWLNDRAGDFVQRYEEAE